MPPAAFLTYIQSRRPVSSFRSSMSQPAGTAVYASICTSRCTPQDSRPKWFATPFFVGLFHPRLSAGLPALTYLTHHSRIPAESVGKPQFPSLDKEGWVRDQERFREASLARADGRAAQARQRAASRNGWFKPPSIGRLNEPPRP